MEEHYGFYTCNRCYWTAGEDESLAAPAKPEENGMSKRRHKKRKDHQDSGQAHAEAVLGLLQSRAVQVSIQRSHLLGVWHSTKRQWGKGSKAATCVKCRKEAVILPGGVTAGVKKHLQYQPTIGGAALHQDCISIPSQGSTRPGVLVGER